MQQTSGACLCCSTFLKRSVFPSHLHVILSFIMICVVWEVESCARAHQSSGNYFSISNQFPDKLLQSKWGIKYCLPLIQLSSFHSLLSSCSHLFARRHRWRRSGSHHSSSRVEPASAPGRRWPMSCSVGNCFHTGREGRPLQYSRPLPERVTPTTPLTTALP